MPRHQDTKTTSVRRFVQVDVIPRDGLEPVERWDAGEDEDVRSSPIVVQITNGTAADDAAHALHNLAFELERLGWWSHFCDSGKIHVTDDDVVPF
jgi:hypothetical protein